MIFLDAIDRFIGKFEAIRFLDLVSLAHGFGPDLLAHWVFLHSWTPGLMDSWTHGLEFMVL